MADRTTKVTLTAQVSGYLSGMDQAAKKTAQFADGSKQKLDAQRQAMTTVGTGAIAMGGAIAAGVAFAVKSFADFDAKMSQVQTLSHATAAQMGQLSAAALHMGQQVGFSATQTADAEIELVKAGVSLSDIMGGALKGSLDLAAAGQIDVGQATEIATIALTQFNLQGKDVPHVADLLAAGADKALGGVSDLGEALKSGGLVAAQFGVSLDETIGTLSAFANAGLLGETAGTDLRQMLLKLANPSAEAQKALDKLGISIYGANGEFVGMSSLAGQLQDKMGKLEPAQRNAALAVIFGSRAIAGANVLYKEGAKGISDWTNEVNDTGFAAQQARGKMDNLKGDINKLGAAFQTSLIEAGSGANGALRGLTQSVTGLVSGIGDLPQPVLSAGLAVAGVGGAVLLAGGTALLAIPKFYAFKTAMTELNLVGKNLGSTLGKGGALVAGVALLANGLAHAGDEATLTADQLARVDAAFQTGNVEDFGKSLSDASFMASDLKGSLDKATGTGFVGWITKAGQMSANVSNNMTGQLIPAIGDMANKLGSSSAEFKEYGLRLSDVATGDLPTAQEGFNKLAKSLGGGKEVIKQLLDAMPDYKAKLIELAGAQGVTLDATDLLSVAQGKGDIAAQLATASAAKQSSALADLSGRANDTDGSISQLADTINNFGKGALDVSSATRGFEQAVDDAADAVKKNGRTLDLTTQKGRDNQAALEDIAKTTHDLGVAQANAGDDTATLTQTMQHGRDEFMKAAQAAGKTKDAAEKLADAFGLIPSDVNTAFNLTGEGQALAAAKKVQDTLDALNGKVSTVRIQTFNEVFSVPGANQGPRKATGGPIHGPGTGTSDDVPIMASNGEWITPTAAAAVPANRRALEFMQAGGVIPGFAAGGEIGATEQAVATWARKLAALQKRVVDVHGIAGVRNATWKTAGTAAQISAAQAQLANYQNHLADLKKDQFALDLNYKYGGQNPADNTSSLISQLTQMSQDTDHYMPKYLNQFRAAAVSGTVAMAKLEKQSTAAADAVSKASDKLGNLKSSSESMVSSITQALQSRVSDAFTEGTSKEVWKKQGNLTWAQTVTTGGGVTASGVASFYASQAAGVAAFASKLKQLAARGVNPSLLAEIAGLGVVQGTQMADALLSASTSQIKSINSSYASIGSSALAAGNTVADANYKALIDSAQKQLDAANKNAATITAAINAQADKLATIIASALGTTIPKHAGGGTVGGFGTGKSDSNLIWASLGEEIIQEPYASQARPLLKAINAGRFGGRTPAYVRSSPGSYAQSAGGAGQPVIVQLEFKDAALRQMVQVEVKQNDDRNLVTLDVM